jgi:hypothetical protein
MRIDNRSPEAGAARASGRWLRRLGVAGFAFFLIKGLAWLALAGLVSLGFVL